jgi:hypothetical protein
LSEAARPVYRAWAFASLVCALAACEAPASARLEFDSRPIEADFAYASVRPLLDGTPVVTDASPPLEDVTLLDEVGRPCARGDVEGTICAPNGTTPVGGAQVRASTRDCDGAPIVVETRTDSDGRFLLRGLAVGTVRVDVRTGSFSAFTDVEVRAGGAVRLAGGEGKLCFSPSSVAIATLTGAYDRIEENLGQLGFENDLYCGAPDNYRPARTLLQDEAALSRYRLLFINCGTGVNLRTENAENAVIIENLRRFVANGGSVYASDLAADFVAQAWPEFVEFELFPGANSAGYTASPCCVCGEGDCGAACITAPTTSLRPCPQPNRSPAECRLGSLPVLGRGPVSPAGTMTLGRIVDPELMEALGFDALPIRFNGAGWIRILGTGPRTRVLVEADGAPLMVSFEPDPGGGRVAFTTFHNEAQNDAAIDAILEALILRL